MAKYTKEERGLDVLGDSPIYLYNAKYSKYVTKPLAGVSGSRYPHLGDSKALLRFHKVFGEDPGGAIQKDTLVRIKYDRISGYYTSYTARFKLIWLRQEGRFDRSAEEWEIRKSDDDSNSSGDGIRTGDTIYFYNHHYVDTALRNSNSRGNGDQLYTLKVAPQKWRVYYPAG